MTEDATLVTPEAQDVEAQSLVDTAREEIPGYGKAVDLVAEKVMPTAVPAVKGAYDAYQEAVKGARDEYPAYDATINFTAEKIIAPSVGAFATASDWFSRNVIEPGAEAYKNWQANRAEKKAAN